MKVEIVTKSGWDEVRDYNRIIIPSVDGDIEILEDHSPMLAFIVPGEIQFFKDGNEHVYQGGDGVLEIQNNKVKILIDYLKDASKK
jgi:F0F1-type ATP synthase epsilon subunit